MALSDEERKARARAYIKAYRASHPEYVAACRAAAKRSKLRSRDKDLEAYLARARRDAKRAYDLDPEKFRSRRRAYRASLSVEEQRELNIAAWEYQKRNRSRSLVYNARQRAKDRGLPCTITYRDIDIPEFCPVLGIKMEFSPGPGGKGFNNSSPSLDRIIPERGYVPGNVRVISYRANSLKKDATAAELRAVVDYIERENARILGW